MAALLRHPFDFCGICHVCGKHCEQRYDFEDVVPNEADTELGVARQYSCVLCHGSYHRDFEPRAGLTDDDIGSIVDYREFEAIRKRALAGFLEPAPLSPLFPARGALPIDAGRYSFVWGGT